MLILLLKQKPKKKQFKFYKDGNYKDCNYNLDEYFYEYEFNSIREETNEL